MEEGQAEVCCGCGNVLPAATIAGHPYMLSSTGCWARYTEVLAREYENPPLFAAVHRLTVDAYAVQHPGVVTDRRANQSVHLHFVSLHLIFAEALPHERATRSLQRLAKLDFGEPPAPPRFECTVADVALTGDTAHRETVERWSRAAYEAWPAMQERAREIVERHRALLCS